MREYTHLPPAELHQLTDEDACEAIWRQFVCGLYTGCVLGLCAGVCAASLWWMG
ncbi:hypothetical protein SLG_21710 [Sphingobium sp. SYK-6]|uniref:hypothetical protein n=1 Tax=Sphingobium sp. (strain NBRC 103272 / SYK-6) TaxID=627192 RepID=UPI00022770A6|nr:hypothetical protein [Sphingobium sp. SYK-6]BAK66846.1 hypothetical protein SLG_21710 [Sphingobium sp. SYK-6]